MMNVSAPSVITKNEENGLRAVLMLELGRKTLLNDLHVYFPTDPVHLYNKLLQHEPTFKKHLKQKILKQDQYDLLLPRNGKTLSKDLDITLIFYLLRTLCKYRPPKTGWNNEPQPTDNTKEANLIRLKLIRNTQQHKGPPEMTDQELAAFEAKISPPLLALGCQNADITNALTCAIDNALMTRFTQEKTRADQAEIDANDEIDRAVKLEACQKDTTYKLLPKLQSFVGRDIEMSDIHTLMVNPSGHQLGIVICGMGGVGKSELARAYASDYKAYYMNNVLWVNGESELMMEQSFRNIAEFTGLSINENVQSGTIKEIVQNVYQFFENQKCLFIFDNSNGDKVINDFLPHSYGGLMKPSVLITSQFTQWGSYFTTIPIDVFPRQVAYDFVNNNKRQEECDESIITELCDLLGYHPFALQHAVSYVDVNNCTYADYASLFTKDPNRLTENSSMFTTLQITLKNIQSINKNDKILHKIIEFIPFLDGNEITKEFILQLFDNDEIGITRALNALHSFSLIKIINEKQPKNGTAVTVHSFVKNAMLFAISRTRENVDSIHELLTVILTTDGASPSKHLTNIFSNDRFRDDTINVCKNETEEFVFAIVGMLLENCQYKVVISFLQEFRQHISNLVYDVNLTCSMAYCQQQSGQYSKALELYQIIEAKQIKLFGVQHHNAIDTQLSIALCYERIGKYNNALQLYQNVESRLKLFAEHHPILQDTQRKIAICYYIIGRYSKTLDLCRKEWIKQLELSGNYGDALHAYENVKRQQVKILGKQHQDVILTQLSIASCYMKLKRYRNALQLYQNIETKQIKLFGEQHEDVICTQQNIALCNDRMENESNSQEA